MKIHRLDELFFDKMFEHLKEEIQTRPDLTQEQKTRILASAEKTHKEAIESRRKLRESGKDIPIGF